MTADPSPELCRQARERGIAQVLGKPFSLEVLVDVIHDALERSPAGAEGDPDNVPWQTEPLHR
jgi:hypothetical protein